MEGQNQNRAVNHYKQISNQKRNSSIKRSFNSRPSENYGPTGNIHGGVLMGHVPHPYHSFSFPPPVFNHRAQMQPPLLPLPISRPYTSMPCRTNNRATPQKPKQPMKRREDLKQTTQASSDYLGPETISVVQLDKFVFTLSPPPSSLPLPKFLPRHKLSCKAQAAAVDGGSTDNLRQMLRLR